MIRQGNDPSRLIPLGLGVGLCIASTEVLRYTVLWPVGTGSPAGHYAELIVLFTLGYALLGLLGHADSRPLWRHRGLMAAIAAFSSAGVAVRALIATGVLDANVPLASIVRFAMEVPYFLMAFWASRLLHLDARQSARAVTLGIVIAGGIQILESLLLGSAVSYAIAALLAPASVALLPHRSETEDEVRAPDRADGPTPTSGALLVLTCALITVASMAVFVIHTQWTGVQDSGAASLSVQICTGLGMVGAGALLRAAASHLMPSSVFDFCFMLVLPAALAGLYLSKAADPLALVVSVVPLNVVYATLLFFVWCIPSICHFALAPQTLSLLAFYLKRVGIFDSARWPWGRAVPSASASHGSPSAPSCCSWRSTSPTTCWPTAWGRLRRRRGRGSTPTGRHARASRRPAASPRARPRCSPCWAGGAPPATSGASWVCPTPP